MWTREELKDRAKVVLQACRWPAVAVCLVMSAVSGGGSAGGRSSGSSSSGTGGSSSKNIDSLMDGFTLKILIAVLAVMIVAIVVGMVISVFVKNPLEVGAKRFFITAREDMNGNVGNLIFGFKNGYLRNVGALLLRESNYSEPTKQR